MNYYVENVFTTSGVPEVTYVEPDEYLELKIALRTPGKCVVIEGPSGIGKTTAVYKALGDLNIGTGTLYSARKKHDLDAITKIANGDFTGTVIIDDFHRLNSNTKEKISNVMKYLADESDETKKIIVIGINRVGDSLVKFSPDLNNRISTIRFESNSGEKILELIEKGEDALNFSFENSSSIVQNSYGSFHVAQLMCHKACIENGISETLSEAKEIHFSFPRVQSVLNEEFSRSYFDIARKFATGNRLRREGRAPYLHVLKWLAESENWSISLPSAMQKHPEAKAGVTQIVQKGYLKDFLNKNEDVHDYIHFDPDTRILSAEDPKFIFYLRSINWNAFAHTIGYLQFVQKPKYDFALSFAGSERNIAEGLFNRLSAEEINVFYDRNEQADILSQNVEEYLYPIYQSEALFVIPLLSKNYPNKIWTKFESRAFKERFGENSVIPIWFNDTNTMFDESKNYGGINFDENGDLDNQLDRIAQTLIQKIEICRLQSDEREES